ncbi:UDP-glucose 4-epimerase GalE [Vibrio hepatarius]|uniref:UDP-glucose 4-epimerase GalE n=1 Tax=Vibrio hepatarius TaxID=171383 RepID=UPI00148CE9AB|nr:UDP-glucose 4-epimerase GalE [Vibrio hepatarius]NOI12934.1 UDP-glucose 4-epimerase GalE [Vibrio hepatarius]
MNVLVTGGCGYIGSHACVALRHAGHTPIVLDNYSNSHPSVVGRIEELNGTPLTVYQGDIRDSKALARVFAEQDIGAVMHFAGLKAVGESVAKPLEYYDNNVTGTLNLLAAMREAQVSKLIFSSSATVYGDPAVVPIDEHSQTGGTTNPYGTSKHMVERCLADFANANPDWSITLLRYFNPIGAHPSGRIGEDPSGIPNNLMPFITQVAIGRRESLSIFGNDYPTEDGTGVRDYIHVEDLVDGHVAALEKRGDVAGLHVYNLGTGNGVSVLQMVNAMNGVLGRDLPVRMEARRAGDIAECFANPAKAEQELGWKAKYSLTDMVEHSWNWQQSNPNGYQS